jgi:hypothetical protein
MMVKELGRMAYPSDDSGRMFRSHVKFGANFTIGIEEDERPSTIVWTFRDVLPSGQALKGGRNSWDHRL